MTVLPAPSEEVVYERIYACNFGMLMRREHPLAALPAVAHRELAGVHLAIDGSRVNKETFCAAENSKFGLTPIIDYDVRHLDLLTSLVESNNCVSIVPAVKYKELSLQGKHPDLVFREYADGAPTAYWGIAYNKRRPLTELGQCFRAFVQSYFTSIDTRYADAQEPSLTNGLPRPQHGLGSRVPGGRNSVLPARRWAPYWPPPAPPGQSSRGV